MPPQLRWFIRTTFMPAANPFSRDAQHVMRFAGALQAMDNDDGQGVLPVRLPVTLAKYLDSGFDFDQPLFARRQRNPAAKEKSCRWFAHGRRAESAGARKYWRAVNPGFANCPPR